MTSARRVLAGSLIFLLPAAAFAQLDSATVRGSVVDEQGQALAGVKVDLEYKGESRQKVVKTVTTDKKGAFIRVGLKPGQWALAFTKEGFKPHGLETWVSPGGISELPPVKLAAASAIPVPASAPGGTGGAAPATTDRARELGESYGKAIEALKAGRSADAEALLKAVVAEVPQLAEAHYNLGYLYAQRNEATAAEAELRKAIELQPQTSDSYVALADLLARNRRGEEALKLMQDAAGGFAEDARFQFAWGVTAFNLGHGPEAERAFSKAVQLDPSRVEAHFFLGSLAVGRNDVPAAVGHLEKYVASARPDAPNLAAARSLLATLTKK